VAPISATYPDRAGHIALSINDDSAKVSALADIARTLRNKDPDRAARLLTGAHHAAQWIVNDHVKIVALAHIVRAWHPV